MDYDDDLAKLLEYNATFGNTTETQFSDAWVVPSIFKVASEVRVPDLSRWTAKLPETFSSCSFTDVAVEKRTFPPEIVTSSLDTFMVTSWEISKNVLDPLEGGRADPARVQIEAFGKKRRSLSVDFRSIDGGRKKGCSGMSNVWSVGTVNNNS